MSGITVTVKVAVVGDAGTGKTTLISTACKGVFDGRPVPVLPPARLPSDFTSSLVPMVVTDTSSRPEDQAVVDLVLQTSDVIVVCFDATRQPTLDSIRNFWYTRTQRLNPDAPMVLSCRVEAAVQDLPSVEVCLNVSAKQQRNVGDIFEYALKGVLYPLQPLYDR
ncbi:P-loop containing nucleoside triphosphate hydrolase protein [Dunaliella salina]|uniref:P-loop containing nucleoside triphosphate hydrolase protein n=1 Tax=Dunaliella salina TaxID=3046 RepID=A0ABQ7H3G3_DUNSA|nr:P-loop containing nucleoside triphosphate hydrolase protein [Dunaliella salina]|eukprot:KAF5841405.1 P-loop containing nucleoside triphosphate hydrolase protein [Dunaliella salina]